MIARSEAVDPLTIRVTDESAERKDLARRKEVKFAVTGADVSKIRRTLQVQSRAVVHNEAISTVRSVYFDDVALSACRANLNGLGRREKLRLRWYDSLRPGCEAFLEVKWRDNRVTGKHRFQVQSSEELGRCSWREMFVALEAVLPPAMRPVLVRYCEPTVLVEYRREHFVSPDRRARLTIDYDIRFYDQTGSRRVSTRFPQPLGDLVVVEGKIPVDAEGELRRLLFPFTARANRCSKYVHGCRTLGLIGANE